jgi:hypothetical protein
MAQSYDGPPGHIFAFASQWLIKDKTTEESRPEIWRPGWSKKRKRKSVSDSREESITTKAEQLHRHRHHSDSGSDSGSDSHSDSNAPGPAPDSTESRGISEFQGLAESGGITSLTRHQLEQYHLAGLPPEYQVPPPPFPSGAYPRPTHRDFVAEVQLELDSLDPPLFSLPTAPNGSRIKQFSQPEKHLAIVNTILHLSLLRGDHTRAERAWAMMLRASYDGSDFRPMARWGIAAELLMARRDEPEPSDDEESESKPMKSISQEAFVSAKSFYERLIIQYPYRRSAIHHNFYPSFFSVWIYQVVQRAKEVDHHRLRELDAATMIADRLESILTTPPHDQNPDLLELHGFVHQWMAHLVGKINMKTVTSSKQPDNPEQKRLLSIAQEACSKAKKRARS